MLFYVFVCCDIDKKKIKCGFYFEGVLIDILTWTCFDSVGAGLLLAHRSASELRHLK